MKVHPVGAELFLKDGRLDGQTDIDAVRLKVTFCNSGNTPKTGKARAISN
jgi:hypothetical protein